MTNNPAPISPLCYGETIATMLGFGCFVLFWLNRVKSKIKGSAISDESNIADTMLRLLK